MGLDNGIILKNIDKKDLPPEIIDKSSFSAPGEIEALYWRKCWNIRRVILDACGGENIDEYEYEIPDAETIDDIYLGILALNNEDTWDPDGTQSVWSFKDIQDGLIRDLEILKWLSEFKETHPEVEIWFYDSY